VVGGQGRDFAAGRQKKAEKERKWLGAADRPNL